LQIETSNPGHVSWAIVGDTKSTSMPTATELSVTSAPIERRIHMVRGRRVMLSADLAELYGVTASALNQAVRRNHERFPDDFMFSLTEEEADNLKSQFVISSWGGSRRPPYAFTEHGVSMLSSVLRGDHAVQMSIAIVRSFVRMRELITANKDIASRIDKLERNHKRAASVIEVLVEDIDKIALEVQKMKALPAPRKRKIGFGL
jgi:hypothetical protein